MVRYNCQYTEMQNVDSSTDRMAHLMNHTLYTLIAGSGALIWEKCWYISGCFVTLLEYYYHYNKMCKIFNHLWEWKLKDQWIFGWLLHGGICSSFCSLAIWLRFRLVYGTCTVIYQWHRSAVHCNNETVHPMANMIPVLK